jgi:hypothetical protein
MSHSCVALNLFVVLSTVALGFLVPLAVGFHLVRRQPHPIPLLLCSTVVVVSSGMRRTAPARRCAANSRSSSPDRCSGCQFR